MIRSLRLFLVHGPSLSVGMAFAALNLLYGSLFTRLPEIQNALHLNQSRLGICLLAMSIGSLLIIPISGWLVARRSNGQLLYVGACITALAFLFPVLANSYLLLFMALLLIGIANGMIGIFVNAAAAAIEQDAKISIMNTCHGMFSIGGVLGAASASLIAGLEISLYGHLLTLIALSILMFISLRPFFLAIPNSQRQGVALALPTRPLWGLAGIAFFIIMTEVAVMDWSAVYLGNELNSSGFVKGLGFAGFSLAMAIGRFQGDQIIGRVGSRRIALVGSYVGIIGLAIIALFPIPIMAIVGFTLIGLGFSCIVPVLFSQSAKLPDVESGIGIATVATAGMLGILLGRPLMGLIAEHWGLHVGFGLLAFFVLGSTLITRQWGKG
ncbi:MAG: MFS transporter [Bacteroidota bacterium]